jgi:hypothetical protein
MACISGYTNDVYYSYFDCCGNLQTGIGPLYQSVCIDQVLSGSAVGVYFDPLLPCTQNCVAGPLSYNFTTNGNCGTISAGTITVNVYGGTQPYTIDNIVPGSLLTQTQTSQFVYTGLTGGTYVFRINDSLGLQNSEVFFNVVISECFTTTVTSVTGTTCGLSNGAMVVSATSTAAPYKLVINKNGNYDSIIDTTTLPYTVTGLDDGIYDVLVYDYGLTTGRTENVIISGSTGVDYGFWVVNAANCVTNRGKAAVTGTTGTGPFTYLWSDGQTSQVATGLTQGVFSVLVTDYYGCTSEKDVLIGQALPLGVGLITSTNPTCASNDGSLTYNLTGGTAPFYYSANTGTVGYTLSSTFTLNNLVSGSYTISIRDANFCELIVGGFLISDNGFYNVSNTISNSVCNQNSGKISTTLNGAFGNYVYALTGLTTNEVRNTVSTNQTNVFENLPNDTYLLFISGQNTTCIYSETIIVSSQEKFSVNVSVTGSTCGSPNGVATINVGTGYTNWDTGNGLLDYSLSNGQQVYDINLTAFTYTSLAAGTYTLNVTDENNCTVTKTFTITLGGNLNSTILTNDCRDGNNGSANVIIFEGKPPFTYIWSNNVPIGETGSTVNNLSGGTYSLEVVDASGCTNYHNFTIDCTSTLVTGDTTYSICSSQFTTTTGTKRGISEMLSEGFLDLTTGYTNCLLNNVILNCNITLNGNNYSQSFVIANDDFWKSAIDTILSSIPEVGSYDVNLLNNTLTIKSNCTNGGVDPIGNSGFILELEMNYDISCEGVLPAPTPTPTATPYPLFLVKACSVLDSDGVMGLPASFATGTVVVGTDGKCYQKSSPNPGPATVAWDGGETFINCFKCLIVHPTPTPIPTATPTPTPIPNYTTWYGTGNMVSQPYTGIACIETGCSTQFYTTGSTLNVGDVIYSDTTLTTNIGSLAVNYGPFGTGWGVMFLSDDCPIVGTRTVVKVNNLGKILSKTTC